MKNLILTVSFFFGFLMFMNAQEVSTTSNEATKEVKDCTAAEMKECLKTCTPEQIKECMKKCSASASLMSETESSDASAENSVVLTSATTKVKGKTSCVKSTACCKKAKTASASTESKVIKT